MWKEWGRGMDIDTKVHMPRNAEEKTNTFSKYNIKETGETGKAFMLFV